ncbi:MAG: HD domain-containing protein [archaeon]
MGFVTKVEQHIKENFEPKKILHAYTVRENALRLSTGMQTDTEVIEISALLHETGTTPMQSSMKALALLSEIEYDEHKKHQIAKLIHNHPFDSFILEQRILFEADKNEHKEKTLLEKIKSFFSK